MKLWAAYNIFNEAKSIEKSLQYSLRYVDAVCVVDGAYKDYPDATPTSTDGTLDIVKKTVEGSGAYLKIITPDDGCWEDQITKRNTYLEHIPKDDWLIVVDGDTELILFGDSLDRIHKNMKERIWDGFWCDVDMHWHKAAVIFKWMTPLIFRNFGGLHYGLNHYSLWDAKGNSFYDKPYKFDYLDATMVNRSNWRAEGRTKANDKYFKTIRKQYASGLEKLQCFDCDKVFTLERGTYLQCPKCKSWNLGTPLKDKLGIFNMIEEAKRNG